MANQPRPRKPRAWLSKGRKVTVASVGTAPPGAGVPSGRITTAAPASFGAPAADEGYPGTGYSSSGYYGQAGTGAGFPPPAAADPGLADPGPAAAGAPTAAMVEHGLPGDDPFARDGWEGGPLASGPFAGGGPGFEAGAPGGEVPQAVAGEPADAAGPEGGQDAGRRPWYVWAAPFAAILAVLLIRNSFMFTQHIYEMADFGADSILVERARHFDLLVGNYSRDMFNHPGPAYMYIMAAGESLFYYGLHIVPTAWNGQVVALYILNSLLGGLTVLVVYGWSRTRGALAATALLLAWATLHVGVYSAPWLPYQDITAFTLFIVAAGSVAAGHLRDSWIATLAGWLLIHRYAVMLLFVPALAVIVVLLVAWPARRRLGSAISGVIRAPKIWVPVVAISVVFALPIVLDTLLHWPGQFGKYLAYGKTAKAGGHPMSGTFDYVLWFWGNGAVRWMVIVAVVAGIVAAMIVTKGPLRRFLACLAILDVIATAVFFYYAINGIDEINEHYIGYFYWGVPLSAVLIVVLGGVSVLADRVRAQRLVTTATAVAAVAALTAFAVTSGSVTTTAAADPEAPVRPPSGTEPKMATAVSLLAKEARGKPIVIYLQHTAWTEMTGFLIQAERTGVTACVAQPWYLFMVTSNFICTQEQIQHGAWFMFGTAKAHQPHGIIWLRRAVVEHYVPPFARPKHPRRVHHRVHHHRTVKHKAGGG